jgi:hypothetical protein
LTSHSFERIAEPKFQALKGNPPSRYRAGIYLRRFFMTPLIFHKLIDFFKHEDAGGNLLTNASYGYEIVRRAASWQDVSLAAQSLAVART